MNDPNVPNQETPNPDPQPKRGRPPALGPNKRKRVLALLDMGCSRRIAARAVGCSPTTITRTMQRDSEFAAQVAEAETQSETQLLESVRKAAKNERYWRAASWLLERKNIRDYKPRDPNLYTPDQVSQLIITVLDTFREELNPDQIQRAIAKCDALLVEFTPSPT